jgi:hypothetical protein
MRASWLLLALAVSQSLACEAKTKETDHGSKSDDDDDDDGAKKKKKRGKGEGKGNSSGSASAHAPATTTATATVAAPATATATATATAAAPTNASFFSGDIPAGVKLKPIKTWAIESGVLFFQPVEEWSGGKLPGNEYMSMSKDQSAVFRVSTHNGVIAQIACKDIASVAALAPAKIKNLEEVSPPRMVAVGRNKFAAREGQCKGEGPKGATELYFIDILREDPSGGWHYEVVVSFPKDAAQTVKDEAKAFARSLEFNGRNGYKL